MAEDKKSLTEEDIKTRYITPALQKRGWYLTDLSMEASVYFTDGRMNNKGNKTTRDLKSRLRADYLLNISSNNPIAIIEAKDNNHTISYGLQQAMTYAKMLDVKFAYSSNGDGFEEFDFITGKQRTLALDEFPSKTDLINRYKKEANITPAQETAIRQPYYSSQKTNSPRYYQRIAINRTLDAIAQGKQRLLLVMATGTGKTYTAFQIVYRLLKSGMKRKVLYLCDRNILADQSIQQDFAPLEKTIHKINVAKDDPTTITSYEVYFSLYQQLVGDSGEEDHYSQLFKKDFFDLIIVDECHRGSAKDDSNWRSILEYFSSATQIGMTATPKETKYVSNINYFGEPLFTYSLKQGIDDGFLAPFKVIKITTDIGDGWRPYKGQKDKNGNVIEDRVYYNHDYDYNIIIEDRIEQVAKEITKYLKATDRMAKTIVFCPNEDAADRMRKALVNLNSDMVKENADYVVRITGSDDYGKGKLQEFISVGEAYPVIATTSQLLSTGADCKMTKLIVLDKCIGSMTEFKQIIGRGTRVREDLGKLYFTIFDFRDVTRLFHDPDFDGPIEQHDDFHPQKTGPGPDEPPTVTPPDGDRKKKYLLGDTSVSVTQKHVQYLDKNGNLITESLIDYTKHNVRNKYASMNDFLTAWSDADRKQTIVDELEKRGVFFDDLCDEVGKDLDPFDMILHIVFDQPPLTRKERAENVRKLNYFTKYGKQAAEILDALLTKYADSGLTDLENVDVLKVDPIKQYGTQVYIVNTIFGGIAKFREAIKELEAAIYAA